jgi:ElaB/YqjD/DUF883 family membrane-anchored ribosome-binding protein
VSTVNDPANGFGADGERSADSVTDRIAEKAHESIDRAAARSNEIEEKLRSRAADAAERVRQSEHQLDSTLEENLERIKAYVRKNPMASAGIAFVAGLVVSSLIRR